MRNKDKFNLGLVALVLILLALGFGYYANPPGFENITTFGWDNSTGQSDGNTEPQGTGGGSPDGDGGSPGGGDQPPDDSPERLDCPACENGHFPVTHPTMCGTCDGDGYIGQAPFGKSCKVCGGDGWVDTTIQADCSWCGYDGYLDPGDPGYPG